MNAITKLQAMRNKKGFTLVELIVVLVILGILIALLVPALTGYIDRAYEKSVMAEGRMVLMASQTIGSEAYATKKGADLKSADIDETKIAALAEVKGGFFAVTFDKSGKVTILKYTSGNYQADYTPTTGFTSSKVTTALTENTAVVA